MDRRFFFNNSSLRVLSAWLGVFLDQINSLNDSFVLITHHFDYPAFRTFMLPSYNKYLVVSFNFYLAHNLVLKHFRRQ